MTPAASLKAAAIGLATVLLPAGWGSAFAQAPVADVQREAMETATAKCMTAAQQFNTQTVAPTKGTQGSVVSPGAATTAPTAAVGTTDLTGGTGTAAAITSLSPGAASTGSVGSINLSPLVTTIGSVFSRAQAGAFNIGTAIQALEAISAATTGLQANSGALRSASQIVGALNPSQGAWDQNSAARLAGTGVWNQAVQAADVTMQLRNQILLSRIMAASAAADFMSAVAASQAGHQ
jgi:hypothetical protein